MATENDKLAAQIDLIRDGIAFLLNLAAGYIRMLNPQDINIQRCEDLKQRLIDSRPSPDDSDESSTHNN